MKDSGSTRKLYSVPFDSQQKTFSVNFLSYDLIHRLKIRPDCGTIRQSSYSSPTRTRQTQLWFVLYFKHGPQADQGEDNAYCKLGQGAR